MKLRVWAEYFSPRQALEPGVMELLSQFDVNLLIAFGPEDINDDFARMLGEYGEKGIDVGLWVLLSDEQGYWGCERNADVYLQRMEQIFDWLQARELKAPWIGVDLEIPIYLVDPVKKAPILLKPLEFIKMIATNRDTERYGKAVQTFKQVQKFINEHDAQTYTAVSSILIQEMVTGRDTIQDFSETPIFPIKWDKISPMVYTSMLTGYSKGLITRRDALWHLYTTCKDLKAQAGDRASVSIGVTYVGKLGDEPYYEKPADMIPDVAALKAAGVHDVAVFNLEGILRAPRPADWFEMILETEAKTPEPSTRVNLAHDLVKTISRIF